MNIGIARAEITPPIGARLSGNGFRDHNSEGVLDDLELRVFWLEQGSDVACIVTADLIGFDDELTGMLRVILSERFGIAPTSIMLAPSHTHSGPSVSVSLFRIGGPPLDSYIAQLRQTIVMAADRARRNVRRATLSVGRSSLTGFAIHRRVLRDGRAVMAPNPDGIRDDEVTTLVFRDAESKAPRAVLFHYTCHPTVIADYRITGDYPGAARRFVEQAIPGVAAGFLAGCPGDVRPNCTIMGGGAFRRGTPEDLAAYGNALGAKVVRAVESAAQAGKEQLSINSKTIAIPLVDGVQNVPLSLQRIDLSEDVALFGIGGDVCVDFGLFVKTLRPGKTTIPVGYANGTIAYICPARYYAEGGYEPAESWVYFGLPGPLSPKTEEVVREALKAL